MPGYNKKGPLGKGPATGGGFGLCNQTAKPSDKKQENVTTPGLGRGQGLRGGRKGLVDVSERRRFAGDGRGLGRQQQSKNDK